MSMYGKLKYKYDHGHVAKRRPLLDKGISQAWVYWSVLCFSHSVDSLAFIEVDYLNV